MPRRSAPARAPASVPEGESDFSPVPRLEADPAASFAPFEVEVDAFGQTWVVPALTAQEWLPLLWAGDVDAVFPGLAGADAQCLEWLLLGDATPEDVFDMACEVVEAVSGMRWWVALNIAAVARASWGSIGGPMVNAGAWAQRMSLGAWLLSALAAMAERIDSKRLAEFMGKILAAPPGHASAYDEDAEARAFLAAMRQPL